ncbi:hypothetical protein [Kordia sp.]|uniref:hypothetical protein n=1 Tax=Kordia sp. TaxID=1965332 RepID=UPI003B5CED43
MSKNVYILRKSKENGELHLFLAKSTDENECKSQQKSICGRMDIEEPSQTIFSCQPEDRARTQCAKIGREMCSTCVSHLYMDKI